MKVCPVCKSRCFDDMDKCYGCLHDFTQEETYKFKPEVTQKIPVINDTFKSEVAEPAYIPEYFELDTFPYIEEESSTCKLNNNFVQVENTKADKFVLKIELPIELINKYINIK